MNVNYNGGRKKKCYVCKESVDLVQIGGEYICKQCYEKACLCEASEVSYLEWQKTLNNFNRYDDGVDVIINRIFSEIKYIDDRLKREELLLKKIKEMLHLHLQYYQKDEAFVALLTIREAIRRLLLKNKNTLDWHVINDISTTTTLLSVLKDIPDAEFENQLVGTNEDGKSNLITAICLARRYNMIKENIQMAKEIKKPLYEICFSPLQTELSEKYFDIYLKNGIEEKPEDYIINNKLLRKKLEIEEKTPDTILNGLQDFLKKEFGFQRKDYLGITQLTLRIEFPNESDYWDYFSVNKNLFNNSPLFIIERELFEKHLGKECLENILNSFSINRNILKQESDALELFSFYEKGKYIIFGNFDLAQNISAFEKMLLSNQFVDIFKNNISKNKLCTKMQKKMSQYLASAVADILHNNGYRLPMENYQGEGIPRSEIDKIKVNKENILSACGDIDVLAIDLIKKDIILVEIKYYAPAISAADMLYKDRAKVEQDEVMRKMQKRQSVIEKNVSEVVEFILGEKQDGYKVRLIFLTPRTNYHALQEDVEYVSWAEFIEKASLHRL